MIHARHDPIACHLCNDACSGDAATLRVSLNDRGLRHWEGFHRKSIDERVVWPDRQPTHGAAHGFVRRLQDVIAVDLIVFRNAHGPDDILAAHEFVIDLIALKSAELLRVRQCPVTELRRQDDCRHDYRTS